jgi:hypothetical protein
LDNSANILVSNQLIDRVLWLIFLFPKKSLFLFDTGIKKYELGKSGRLAEMGNEE